MPRFVCTASFWLLTVGLVYADITFDAATRTIRVTGFPEDRPASPASLHAAATQGGWGNVQYEASADTYRIKANLHVGAGNDTVTYFRMGSAEHPGETLVLAGNLRISAPSPGGFDNVFQMGLVDDDRVRPVLKIACDTPGQYAIHVGVARHTKAVFNVYHSVLTAAVADPEHIVGQCRLVGGIDWRNSQVSWFASPAYGSQRGAVFKGNTFSHCERVFPTLRDENVIEDCTFAACALGIYTPGPVSGTFRGCVFRNNRRNLLIRKGGTCVLVDPDLGPAERPDTVSTVVRSGKPQRGQIVVRRTMVLEVVDQAGHPVPGALVDVTNEVEGGPVPENGRSATDEQGLTPDKFSSPITVTDYIQTAPEGEEGLKDGEGVKGVYTYRVDVSRQGYRSVSVTGIDPDNSWSGKVVELTVKLKRVSAF